MTAMRRLHGYPYCTLTLWLTAMALGWLAFCSPWPRALNLVLGISVLLASATVLTMVVRRRRARHAATQAALTGIEKSLDGLPAELRFNIPLVLVLGEVSCLNAVFGEHDVRLNDAAIWIAVKQTSQLPHLADALKYWRDGQGPEAVVCLMRADDDHDQARQAAGVQAWRSAIARASRAIGYALPVCIAAYLQDGPSTDDKDGTWIGASEADPLELAPLAQRIARLLERRLQTLTDGNTSECAIAGRSVRVEMLSRWMSMHVLPLFAAHLRSGTPATPIHAFGVTTINGLGHAQSLFSHHLSLHTGLKEPSSKNSAALPNHAWPLPGALLAGIAAQPARPALSRAISHALIWLALFFCAAAAASAWQNRMLVQRLFSHSQNYTAIAPEQHEARRGALQLLKQDRDELESYVRTGVPLRLGLGFYQGGQWLPRIHALIVSYQPPAPPPVTIELDSMSLFRSGSASLNPGSNRALVGALEMIKAHPDKRVLIAGHTDTVGNPRSNLALSQARAASVRDWLADASGLPTTHFATQGYGDTRPKAPNDTETGRAANRRVEITLIPDCRSRRTPAGQTACSFN